MRRPVLKDIAEACGTSIATVSLILSGKGSISPAVSERVKAVAAELGYTRRGTTAGERKRNFRYIAILQWEDAPYLWNFSQPFAGLLEEQVSRKGFYPLIIHIQANATTASVFKEITGARVGAVFTIHYTDPVLFENLEAAGIPVIIINNCEYQTRFYSVLADEVQGAYEATMHLIGHGHRRIGYADYFRPDYPTLVKDRFFGFRKALEESRLEFREEHRIQVPLTDFDSLLDRISGIYTQENPPTAFAVHDDYFAANLLEALRRIGLQVPGDVSLLANGGDVLDYRVPFIPKLDTMQIDRRLMVSMAWNLLESRLQYPSTPVQVLKTKMPYMARGSCAPPRPDPRG